MRKLILNAIKQDAIHNNQTIQNQPLIFKILTNKNEKTTTHKIKATNIKRQKPEREGRESLRDSLRKGYGKVRK